MHLSNSSKFLLRLIKEKKTMYNRPAPQNIIQEDFYILLLMGGCARIPFGVLGSLISFLIGGNMKAIIPARVSSKEQEDNNSIPLKHADCTSMLSA